jgi:hypothetical protein
MVQTVASVATSAKPRVQAAPRRPPSPAPRRGADASAWCRRGSAAPRSVMRMSRIPTICGDDADLLTGRLEPRSLLDMQFHESREARSGSDQSPARSPSAARASAKLSPPASVSASASSSGSAPDQTALPVVTPKRPSSSSKLTTETGGPPACRAARATSSAAITPSAPSSQPPSGWLSVCDPSSSPGPCPPRRRDCPPGRSRAGARPPPSAPQASRARQDRRRCRRAARPPCRPRPHQSRAASRDRQRNRSGSMGSMMRAFRLVLRREISDHRPIPRTRGGRGWEKSFWCATGRRIPRRPTRTSYDRLSDLGRQQAAWLGDWLRTYEAPFDAVYMGGLRRHLETAEAMGDMGAAPALDAATERARLFQPEPGAMPSIAACPPPRSSDFVAHITRRDGGLAPRRDPRQRKLRRLRARVTDMLERGDAARAPGALRHLGRRGRHDRAPPAEPRPGAHGACAGADLQQLDPSRRPCCRRATSCRASTRSRISTCPDRAHARTHF